jgi:hypothetical protein
VVAFCRLRLALKRTKTLEKEDKAPLATAAPMPPWPNSQRFEPAIVEAAQYAVAEAETEIGFVRLHKAAFWRCRKSQSTMP